jgi:NADH dehydrogenase [ubiquinone] 1 alpha subcomplex assembly factor 7
MDLDGSPHHFRYVLAPEKTPAVIGFTEHLRRFQRDCDMEVVEYSPEAITYAQSIAKQLQTKGGFGWIMDYGHDRPSSASLRVRPCVLLVLLLFTRMCGKFVTNFPPL